MKKLVEYIVMTLIISVVWLSILAIGLVVLPRIIYGYLNYTSYPHSYIKSINSSGYGINKIKICLDNFNKMGDNKIVRYNKDTRPIYVQERTLDYPYLGLTYTWYKDCHINITSGLSKEAFRSVLLHEYVHCFGFGHVSQTNREDLMTPAYMYPPSEFSIFNYAQRIKHIYDRR